jgi:hypothetical protein
MQREATSNAAVYLALTLAIIAAVASMPRGGPRIDDALLALLESQGAAEMSAIVPGGSELFVSP